MNLDIRDIVFKDVMLIVEMLNDEEEKKKQKADEELRRNKIESQNKSILNRVKQENSLSRSNK